MTTQKKPRRSSAHWGNCMICSKRKLVWWEQRGMTQREWVRVCTDCLRKITTPYRRDKAPKRQLDLFAK